MSVKKVATNQPEFFQFSDGNLNKAIELIHAAKKAGANAAKCQHFHADTIVSNKTFSSLRNQLSHQSKWIKSVYDVYKDASLDLSWTPVLYKECKKVGIDFFTSTDEGENWSEPWEPFKDV